MDLKILMKKQKVEFEQSEPTTKSRKSSEKLYIYIRQYQSDLYSNSTLNSWNEQIR